MSNEKPLALRLADAMRDGEYLLYESRNETEAELRRLHAESEENARVIGAGSEREARMMAQVEELLREVERLKAQPAEPVAWRYQNARGHYRYVGNKPEWEILKPIPLYAAPPVAARVPLTDEAAFITAVKKLGSLSAFLSGWQLSDGCKRNEMEATVQKWIDGIHGLYALYDGIGQPARKAYDPSRP